MSTTDPYAVLGVPRDADDQRIKTAYRRLMRTHHPDAGGDSDEAARIGEAYRILNDPALRAELDLDTRRAAERATGDDSDHATPSSSARTAGPARAARGTRHQADDVVFTVPPPPPGPVSLRDLRWTDWVPTGLAVLGLVGALAVEPSVVPVLLVTGLLTVAVVLAVNKVRALDPRTWLVPAVVLTLSVEPVSGWLGTGTAVLVAAALMSVLTTVLVTLWHANRLRASVGYTDEYRWIFSGPVPHPFLASLGNVTGWVGLTGTGRFDTALMNGRTVLMLRTVRPTHPGERLHWSRGRLLRTRAGSSTSVADPNVDLLGWRAPGSSGLDVSYAVFVPGLDAGKGRAMDEVSVVGEQDILDWMSTVPTTRLDRRDVLRALDLVGARQAQV